jgi:hypothetical protein
MINGVPRYGVSSLLKSLGAAGEGIRVGGRARMVFLKQATADPDVQAVSLGKAQDRLREAFEKLPQLARDLEKPPRIPRELAVCRRAGRPEPLVWSLALDELQETGVDLRPRLPLRAGEISRAQRGSRHEPPLPSRRSWSLWSSTL